MRSPTRQVALLSLVTIGRSTLVLGLVPAHVLERGLLDREWASTAAFVRAVARAHLCSADFTAASLDPPADSADRLADVARASRRWPRTPSSFATWPT